MKSSAGTPRASWFGYRLNAGEQALAITAAFVLVRLLLCAFVGLGTNEAYAIASGRLQSLSYFDHPPLHFWLAHAGELLFGDTRAARVPFIALGAGTSWLMFALTRRLYGDRAGVWATLALNSSIFFSLVSGNWILPDGPLNFFLLASALVLAPLAEDRPLGFGVWLAAGLFVGLAALSKYHALVFASGVLFFLLSTPSGRAKLRTAGPWAAAIVATAVFCPVLIWNGMNHWISFRFQGARASGSHFGLGIFLSLLAAQFALLSPWVAVPLLRAVARASPRADARDRFLLWLGLPSAIFFTLVPLWSDGGMVQWAMPGWLLLLPLTEKYLADETARAAVWPRRWASASAAAVIVFAALACVEIQTGLLGHALPKIFRRGDPTAENVEWKRLAAVVNSNNLADSQRNFVVTSEWRDGAKIDQGLGGHYRVLVASSDPRNFRIDVHPSDFAGKDGWIVLRARLSPQSVEDVRRCFTSSHWVAAVTIFRAMPDAKLTVWRGTGYLPQRCRVLGFP